MAPSFLHGLKSNYTIVTNYIPIRIDVSSFFYKIFNLMND